MHFEVSKLQWLGFFKKLLFSTNIKTGHMFHSSQSLLLCIFLQQLDDDDVVWHLSRNTLTRCHIKNIFRSVINLEQSTRRNVIKDHKDGWNVKSAKLYDFLERFLISLEELLFASFLLLAVMCAVDATEKH